MGDAMTEEQSKAVEDARCYIHLADRALADCRRAFPDDRKYKGDLEYAQKGLDQAWTGVRIMVDAVEAECAGEGDA